MINDYLKTVVGKLLHIPAWHIYYTNVAMNNEQRMGLSGFTRTDVSHLISSLYLNLNWANLSYYPKTISWKRMLKVFWIRDVLKEIVVD